jgi:hypothetical protein
LLGALISGCVSRISPQIFPPATPASEELRSQLSAPLDCREYSLPGAKPLALERRLANQNRLCVDRARADLLRQEYVSAVVDHSTENSVLSAVLLAIAGAAGYQLLKNGFDGTTTTLNYLAATGATVYGYSTLTYSPARQLIHLAGAEALTCIYEASDQIQIPAAGLREIVGHSKQLLDAISTLLTTLGKTSEAELKRPDRCTTKPARPGTCSSGANGAGMALFAAAPPAGCAARPASKSCDLALIRAIAAAEEETKTAEALHAAVEASLNDIDRTAAQVRAATDAVSYSTGKEVLKTEASPAAALAAIQSMRSVMAQLGGTGQSGPKVRQPAGDRVRHPDLEADLYALRTAMASVREDDDALRSRLSDFKSKMLACQSSQPANQISVSPPPGDVTLVPNQPLSFQAVGTSSAPVANIQGDPSNAIAITRDPNGNRVTVTTTLTKADKDVAATLEFASPGATPVKVFLTYFAPAKPKK